MEYATIIKNNRNAIVALRVSRPNEANKEKMQVSIVGSGFITDKKGTFITCAHVYNKIPEKERELLEVLVPQKADKKKIVNYKAYKADLVKIGEANDMAVLKISAVKERFAVIAGLGDSNKVREGEQAIFIGYPMATELLSLGFGLTMSSNACIISSIKQKKSDGGLKYFMVDSHVNNGSSGSPIFSKKTGKVLGVMSGKISLRVEMPQDRMVSIPANMGICRPVNDLKRLI